MARRTLGWILVAALIGAPATGRAQSGRETAPSAAGAGGAPRPGAAATDPARAGLVAERQRLRAELDRVNAEIDALKRDDRGLRDDYRLRGRMADAEALARRLTNLDGRLQAGGGGAGAATASRDRATAPWPAAPEAKPSDDRAVLEAKADILTDQARRLNSQADLLANRVTELRARHELRRRAGQLERDPFSPMEQAKRRLAVTGGGTPLGFANPNSPPMPASDSTGNPPPRSGETMTPTAGGPPSLVTSPTSGVGQSTVGVPTSAVAGGSIAKAQPSPVAASAGGDSAAGSVSTQFRGILDASTLAEIRRLELAGSPSGSLPAMERALSALRARAAQLSANAATLRSRAQTNP